MVEPRQRGANRITRANRLSSILDLRKYTRQPSTMLVCTFARVFVQPYCTCQRSAMLFVWNFRQGRGASYGCITAGLTLRNCPEYWPSRLDFSSEKTCVTAPAFITFPEKEGGVSFGGCFLSHREGLIMRRPVYWPSRLDFLSEKTCVTAPEFFISPEKEGGVSYGAVFYRIGKALL